jgi:hypothetical protein
LQAVCRRRFWANSGRYEQSTNIGTPKSRPVVVVSMRSGSPIPAVEDVVGSKPEGNKSCMYSIFWNLERPSAKLFTCSKGKTYWCCSSSHPNPQRKTGRSSAWRTNLDSVHPSFIGRSNEQMSLGCTTRAADKSIGLNLLSFSCTGRGTCSQPGLAVRREEYPRLGRRRPSPNSCLPAVTRFRCGPIREEKDEGMP